MPPRCYICNYYDPKKMSLFRIPDRNDEFSDRGGLWLKLLEEKPQNINQIRICSDHFSKKKPAKSGDYLDIDWVPNQNLGRFSKNRKLIDYYYRTKKKVQPEGYLNRLKINDYHELEQPSQYPSESSMAISSNVEISVQDQSIDSNQLLSQSDCVGENFVDTASSNNTQAVGNALIPLKKKKIHIIEQKILFPRDIQTDLTSKDVDMLFQYYREAVEERNQLLQKMSTLVIDVDFFKGNNKKTRFYTGLTTWSLLKNFFDMIESYLPTHFNCKLSKFQMVVLTLMKLRLNLLFTDLGYRFQVEVSTASKYFHRCLYILFKLFSNSKLIYWPEERRNLLSNTPNYFRSTFKDLITVIVDCFEIFIERSSDLMAAAQAFSQYKHHATLKYLIGISTTGAIIFVSQGFGGRASDKKVSIDSGFVNKLEEGDFVLADKGFLIEDEVKAKKASLRIPSFVRNGNQLEPHEIEQSRHYSSIRIHVERLISVVRQKFNICSDVAQMSAVSKHNDLFNNDLYDKIVFICCCLVNICPSVVSTDFEI